jgi:superfamily II DNA or RNA helicase
MNRLSTIDRTRAIACLVEGNSQRATCRITGLECPANVCCGKSKKKRSNYHKPIQSVVILRCYQHEACESIMRDFASFQSTLAVLPTGTGKSLLAAEVVRRFIDKDTSVCWIAHRQELLTQAQRTIEAHAGLECEYELGERKASEIFPAPVLLASVQTLCSGRNGARRMHKFSPHNYGLLVIDEFHHATAASYRAVIDYFKANKDLKILGVTATPERADKEALGQICESVAFDYSIQQAIKDGWLVPVQQQLIDIQSLDFSHVRTTAGDLNGADLAAVMESERKAIMFTVSVRQAEMAADILNRYKVGVARFASGKTPVDERRSIMQAFSEGSFQVLVNCNLVSEGFDVPDAELLIQARPTKSKLLYTQQLGRIMRPLPGTVDFEQCGASTTLNEGGDAQLLHHKTTSNAAPTFNPAARRRDAIANSAKPVAVVMDFVGNAGRHKLIHAIDILGGNVTPEVRELAETAARKTGRPTAIDQMVINASMKADAQRRALEAARKARLTAKATYSVRTIDPFNSFDITAPPTRAWDSGKTLSEKQRSLLRRQHLDPDMMTYSEGKAVIAEMFRRFNGKLATLRQCHTLKRFGYDTHDLTMQGASELLNQLALNGWKRSDV